MLPIEVPRLSAKTVDRRWGDETRFATTPSRHELHVVRFSAASGIEADQPVVLD